MDHYADLGGRHEKTDPRESWPSRPRSPPPRRSGFRGGRDGLGSSAHQPRTTATPLTAIRTWAVFPSRRSATAPTRAATTTGATSTRPRTATGCSFTPTPPGPRHADLGPALGPGLDPPLTAANVVQNSIIKMGQDERLQRRLDRGRDSAGQPRDPVQLQRHLVLHLAHRPRRRGADRAAGLHRRRRCIHRCAQRVRHRLQLGLVPRAARRRRAVRSRR